MVYRKEKEVIAIIAVSFIVGIATNLVPIIELN